jgi:hypothetical protein
MFRRRVARTVDRSRLEIPDRHVPRSIPSSPERRRLPLIDGWFDDLASSGDYIDPRIPAQDHEDLRMKTSKIRKWVNTSVAHLTAKGRPLGTPPIQHVDDSIDVVAGLFRTYMNLIQGVLVDPGVVMSPWPRIFRGSWIPDEDHFQSVMTKVNEAEARRREAAT